jgi:hypothetical protein
LNQKAAAPGYLRETLKLRAMIDQISVSNINEVIYWADVFRVLGIKRCQPLLTNLGVSATMAECPAPLLEAAHHFWRHTWEGIRSKGVRVGTGLSDPGFPENYRLGIQTLLREIFALIVRNYDEDEASNLYQWAQRFFTDQAQVNMWFTWSLLFASQSVSTGSESADSQLSPLIRKAIQTDFSPAAEQEDAAFLSNVERVPLTAQEQRMIALEVTQPTDFREVDLHGLLARLMRFQHAYLAWVRIDKDFSGPELETLLWWGYEQAAALNIPAEDVMLPASP